MRTHFENQVGPKGQRVAHLWHKTAELERELAEARMSLEEALARPGSSRTAANGQILECQIRERHHCNLDDAGHEHDAGGVPAPATEFGPAEFGPAEFGPAQFGPAQFDFADPDFAEPDFAEPDFAEPSFAGPYFAGPGLAGPYGASLDFAEPDFAEPDFPEPGLAAPYFAGPGLAGPSGAGPDSAEPDPAGSFGGAAPSGQAGSPDRRTETLVNRGRGNNYRLGLQRWRKVAAATALVAVLGTILVVILSGGGASWPPSVATVQSEAARACQNPDVQSEPGQVNFACAPATRQILWAFSLITSANDPNFADAKTGRDGLEPITPGQGAELAWSLNLHHPYSPSNPVDSLEVAARAINNIIGGATLTSTTGTPVVQPGLESDAQNCLRYTGSAALHSRAGFPSLCARPVSTLAGQAALVADVYQKWVVGAPPATAEDAAVLFENANNPGDPQVQAILRQFLSSGLAA